MKRKKFIIITSSLAILIIASMVWFKTRPTFINPEECRKDSDCRVFGSTGICGCGCYNRTYKLPKFEDGPSTPFPSGMCYCAAPDECRCENNKCKGVIK